MGNPQVTARVEQEVADRLDRVAAALNRAVVPGMPAAQQSDAVRAVLLRGLPVMEKELRLSPQTPRRAPKRRAAE